MKSIKFILTLILITGAGLSNAQTCSDGIQNGSETGIDCGGTCPPCSTPCNVTLVYSTPTIAGPDYTMSSGTITTDNGTFYDPGGPTASYGNNNINTQTFCASTANGQLQFEFTQWALETCCDYLTIYDGPTASGTQLFYGNGSSFPGTVTSTNGCLTFVWDSDGSVVGAGWTAIITLANVPALTCNGGDIILTADGQGASVLAIDNDFDFGNAGSGWTSNVAASFNNPCDPSIDGGTYMWMGSSAQHPRIIQTVPLDLSCGGDICFWLDFATQGNASPCEGIDLPDEGVYLEYSTDGGTSWTTLEYFGPAGVGNSTSSGGTNPQMTSWNQYCYNIPLAAQTTNTIIHWAQTGSSGASNDHWGIDNVTISSVANCTPYWYDYTGIGGTNDSPVQNATITSDTTFYVTYSNGTDMCSTEVTINLPPCPCPDATVSGGGTYCQGDDIPNVTFTVNGGANPITLVYAIDGVNQPPLVFNVGDSVFTDPVEGEYTIVSVTDPSLCTGTFSGTVDVIANPAPILNSFVGGNTYCAGDLVDNLLVDASGSGTLTIDYTLDGVAQTPISGSSPLNLGNAPGEYIITALSDAGCTTPIADTQTIIVYPIPNATAGTSTAVICAGDDILLTSATSTGTYSWTGPNSFSSSNEDPTISNATVAASGTYSLTITENGCTSQPSTVDVTVNPVPVVTTNSNSTICLGTPVTLSGQGATSYTWSGGVVDGVEFTPGSTNTYTVTGTSNGCTATAQVTVTVLPLPVAMGDASVNDGYAPLAVSFTNESLNATNYLWTFGNGFSAPTSSTSSVGTTYSTPGTYYVLLTASNGICDSTWSDSIVVISYPAMVIHVPNVFSPNGDDANDQYVIDVVNGKSFEATIVNRWGNVVFVTTELNKGWDGKINGNPASEGVYFVKYKVEGLDTTIQEGHTYFHLVR